MNDLESLLRDDINTHGAMPFARFMETCLFHPTLGYYNTHDPLQDFATAPEISQLFGEMITLWCIDVWLKLGSPDRFTLLECGPGRGTLMADVLRTARVAPEFLSAAQCYMLEKSPYLKAKQQATLYGQNANWVADLRDFPNGPVIMFCNEFFDAFAVQPFVKTVNGWGMRAVGLVENNFAYAVLPAKKEHQSLFSDTVFQEAPVGAIAEINTCANEWIEAFDSQLNIQGGAALIIDYGYAGPELANTVQAIFDKKMSPVFKHIGDTDITAHVDFTPFETIALRTGIHCSALQPMGDFLQTLGIQTRAERLKANATQVQQEQIDAALHRLTASEQMGHLFKVMCHYHKTMAPPIGCEA
ncbi:MAG: SAM-dependent methyltransferase [Alphaproteobacteria bacterium]|nr:SAM-dependent methyltransferase [Alphaproteobacteria bacterium]